MIMTESIKIIHFCIKTRKGKVLHRLIKIVNPMWAIWHFPWRRHCNKWPKWIISIVIRSFIFSKCKANGFLFKKGYCLLIIAKIVLAIQDYHYYPAKTSTSASIYYIPCNPQYLSRTIDLVDWTTNSLATRNISSVRSQHKDLKVYFRL